MTIVAFDGPTGVGKSTTARAVAERLGATLLLDPVSVSPLLSGYYNGEATPSAVLDHELAFLRGRANVLAAADEQRLVIADFTVARTGPFTSFLSDHDDREVVVNEMRTLLADGPLIDVIVLLDADPQALFDRVQLRNRQAEGKLTIEHLTELRRHFRTWRTELIGQARAAIEIDTALHDLRDPEDLDELINRLMAMLRPEGPG